MEKFKCASFFAGIGGIDLAFEQTGLFEVIYANEKDRQAVVTYEMNSSLKVDVRSIEKVLPNEIPDFDIALAGFPCNDLSVAGHRKGFFNEDGSYTKSGMFFEFARILYAKQPKAVFMENVEFLAKMNNGSALNLVLDTMKELGYFCSYAVLNAREYGNTPQSRNRIYIVCFRNETDLRKFSFPEPIPLSWHTQDLIDFYGQASPRYYYSKKYKAIYDKLLEASDGSYSVYSLKGNTVTKCNPDTVPTIITESGGHNIPVIYSKYGFRKLLPSECFVLQGFPESFIIPPQLSNKQLYKQAGNTVCVDVVRRIAEQIAKAIS